MFRKVILSLILLSLILQQISFAKPNSTTEKKLKDYLQRTNAYGFSGQVLIAENSKILSK